MQEVWRNQCPDCRLEAGNKLRCSNLATFHGLRTKHKISRKSDALRREIFEADLTWADYKTNQPFIKQAIMYLTIWINIIHANIIYVKYILELLCTIFSSSKSSDQKCTYICSNFSQCRVYPIFLLPMMKKWQFLWLSSLPLYMAEAFERAYLFQRLCIRVIFLGSVVV